MADSGFANPGYEARFHDILLDGYHWMINEENPGLAPNGCGSGKNAILKIRPFVKTSLYRFRLSILYEGLVGSRTIRFTHHLKERQVLFMGIIADMLSRRNRSLASVGGVASALGLGREDLGV